MSHEAWMKFTPCGLQTASLVNNHLNKINFSIHTKGEMVSPPLLSLFNDNQELNVTVDFIYPHCKQFVVDRIDLIDFRNYVAVK